MVNTGLFILGVINLNLRKKNIVTNLIPRMFQRIVSTYCTGNNTILVKPELIDKFNR